MPEEALDAGVVKAEDSAVDGRAATSPRIGRALDT
jgi:hypothetical protein